MFLDLDARVERFGRVVVQHRYCGLKYDRPRVDSGVDEVDCASGDLRAVFKRLRPAVEAGECREKGGVDVEDALWKGVEEAGLDDDAEVRRIGGRYRDTILSLGGSKGALDVFREFRGRDPEIGALLRQTGLA